MAGNIRWIVDDVVIVHYEMDAFLLPALTVHLQRMETVKRRFFASHGITIGLDGSKEGARLKAGRPFLYPGANV